MWSIKIIILQHSRVAEVYALYRHIPHKLGRPPLRDDYINVGETQHVVVKSS